MSWILDYTCVGISEEQKEELEYIKEHGTEIRSQTFKRKIGAEKVLELEFFLGYVNESGTPYNPDLRFDSDYAVRFLWCRLKTGETVYVCVHSGIEFVYTKEMA